MRHLTLLCVALTGALFAFTSMLRADDATAQIGKPAPQFSLVDQNGNTVNLKDFAGKIVVLEWTNPHCPFVKRAYAEHEMTNLASEYESKNVVWLAINSTSTATQDEDKQWAQSQNIPYPILLDNSGDVGHAYHATNTPHMFIIGTDGNLLYSGAIDNDPDGDKGASKINYVNQALQEILSGKPVSQPVTTPYGCTVKYAH